MTQGVEGFVITPATTTGSNIRNLQLTVLQPNGTYATVLMQVVAIADPVTGVPLDLVGQDWRDEMLKLNRAQVKGLENICEALDADTDILDQQQTDE